MLCIVTKLALLTSFKKYLDACYRRTTIPSAVNKQRPLDYCLSGRYLAISEYNFLNLARNQLIRLKLEDLIINLLDTSSI